MAKCASCGVKVKTLAVVGAVALCMVCEKEMIADEEHRHEEEEYFEISAVERSLARFEDAY